MDYGKLLNRAWEILWRHKFLVILGLIVALSGGFNTSASSGTNAGFRADSSGAVGTVLPPELSTSIGLPFWTALLLFALVLAIAFVLWVISTTARGGLIAGAAASDSGQDTSFSRAWRAGWQRIWTLLGIGIIPAIPGLIVLLVGGLAFLGNVGFPATEPGPRILTAILVVLVCIALPLALVLELLRVFANRACFWLFAVSFGPSS